mgnify:CR=1 FL=1
MPTGCSVSFLRPQIDVFPVKEQQNKPIEHHHAQLGDERPPERRQMRQKTAEEKAFDIERYKKQPVCGVGYDNCCITANGDVYPCAGWQSMVIGNVYKQPLLEIWENSPKVKELRKLTRAAFPQCLECEAADFCAMCLVRNYNESGGDMLKINKHFCDVAFLNKRLVEEYFGKDFNKKN